MEIIPEQNVITISTEARSHSPPVPSRNPARTQTDIDAVIDMEFLTRFSAMLRS